MTSLTPKAYVFGLTAAEIEQRLNSLDNFIQKDVIRQSLNSPAVDTIPSTQAVSDALDPIQTQLQSLGDLAGKDSVSLDSEETAGVLPLNKGGTGGNTVELARQNLGILTQDEIQNLINESVTEIGSVDLSSPQVTNVLPVVKGGTGANTPSQARANLGVWSSVQSEVVKTNTKEALRRSYAEAGYNLVDGSFQTGFTLVNANDLALDEVTGKAYSGTDGTYPSDTSTSGFIDKSHHLLSGVLVSTGSVVESGYMLNTMHGSLIPAANTSYPFTIASISKNNFKGVDITTTTGITYEYITKEVKSGRSRGELSAFGLCVSKNSTENQQAFQKAIDYCNIMGIEMQAEGGEFNCKPVTVGRGFRLRGKGCNFSSNIRPQKNVTAWMCDLQDGEDFITYSGVGWPQGDVMYSDCAFVNLNNYANPISVIAGNNRAFWAVDQQDDVFNGRWIQKKTGGTHCPKLTIERVNYVSFFIGHDVHSYMAKYSQVSSYTCGMTFRHYGTSMLAELIWPNDPLWCGMQVRCTYGQIDAGSFAENAVTSMATRKNGLEFHNGFLVVNGVGQEAIIDSFIWAYNGTLHVNASRPTTDPLSLCKKFLHVEAFCNVWLNSCYNPACVSETFTTVKERFATNNIHFSSIGTENANALPFSASGYDATAGVYSGLIGVVGTQKNRAYIMPLSINYSPKDSTGELNAQSLEWKYDGVSRFDGALQYRFDVSVSTNYVGDGGFSINLRINNGSSGYSLSKEFAGSGVIVTAKRVGGVWSFSYNYYGNAADVINDQGQKMIEAFFFSGSPASTVRLILRNKVMNGVTIAQKQESRADIEVSATGTLSGVSGENEPIVILRSLQ